MIADHIFENLITFRYLIKLLTYPLASKIGSQDIVLVHSRGMNSRATEYKHTEDYLKRKTIEKYVRCFVDWPPCFRPVTAHAPFTLLTMRMCSYWLRTWRPHMCTPFAHAFAYAIKQTPYAFASKIILCMYLLYGRATPLKFVCPRISHYACY